jgi:hypothetical protein
MARVRQQNRIAFPRIARSEQRAARFPAALRHRLDHRVDVAGVIEVLVREHDRIELRRPFGRHRAECANQGPGTRIDVDLGRAEAHPHPARGADLLGHDEARTAGAEEADRNAHSPVSP